MSYLTNMFKKLNSLKEEYDFIPRVLYHATYASLLPDIKHYGLVKGKRKNWDISGDYIYLSADKDNAYSYAETSEIVPEEWLHDIIVLKIDTSKLDLSKLDIDHNINYGIDDEVDVEDPYTWIEYQYDGNISPNAIIDILTENKSLNEDIEGMKKFYPNIPDDKFQTYIELDPTYRKGSTQAGKYAKWILGLANKSKLDNIGHVSDLLSRFESVKRTLKNKDIMSYRSMDELEDALNDQSNYNELSDRQELRQTQKAVHNTDLTKDASLVFESEMWEVWIPKTYEASCKLGRGTSWCTASTEHDYYYKQYSNQGPLYINIHKVIPDSKYQFHFESEQFMNADDHEIDIFEFLFEENKELVPFYNSIICKWLELEEGTDLYEYTQCVYNADDIEYILSSGVHGEVSGDVASRLICHPEDQYGEWDFSYVEVTEELINEINNENKEKIKTITGTLDYSDVLENDDVRGIILNAAEVAYEDGSITEAHNDAVRALEKSVSDIGRGEWNRDSGEFVITYMPYQVLKEYYSQSSQYFNNILKDSISQIISDNYRLFEPQYGWNEFNSALFNEYISNNI